MATISLKQAFRYQNKLQDLMNNTIYLLNNSNVLMKTTILHKCSEANPNAQNRTEEVKTNLDREYDPDMLVVFADAISRWQYSLTNAITAGKAALLENYMIDLDARQMQNKKQRTLITAIENALKNKSRTITKQATGYLINGEGNQTPYTYEADYMYTTNYDSAAYKERLKILAKEVDERSETIEAAQLKPVVDYELPFDINEDFDDIFDAFSTPDTEQ